MAFVKIVASEAVTCNLVALLPNPYAPCWAVCTVVKEPILNQQRCDLLVALSSAS